MNKNDNFIKYFIDEVYNFIFIDMDDFSLR